MARRVYVHVGTMKSATSYLQALLDANRDAVLAQGVYWGHSVDNFLATDDLLGTRRLRPGLDGAWDRLSAALAGHPGDAVVSNELLTFVNPRKRALLLGSLPADEVHVVVTARDLARVLPSQWQTGARNRSTIPWADYVDAVCHGADDDVAAGFWRRQDVPAIVERWSRDVGLDRVCVVTVPPRGVDHRVVGERFGAAVGLDVAGFADPRDDNRSVGAHSAEVLRRVNERTADLDHLRYRYGFKNGLARLVLAARHDREPPVALSAAQVEALQERAGQLIEALRESGVRVIGDLEDLRPAAVSAAAPAVDPAAADPAALLDASVDGLVGLGDLLAQFRIEHDLLVRLLDALVPEEPGERAAFEAADAALAPDEPADSHGAQLLRGRYARWRAARRVAD